MVKSVYTHLGDDEMIAIIDYGAGNIQSVRKALAHIGCDCFVTREREDILKADGAVLPGVGSFGSGIYPQRKAGFGDLPGLAAAFSEKRGESRG